MSEMVEPTIGGRIRELRHSRFTQIDLAVAADVSVDVIRKLEQGRRHTASIATLVRIARVLGVDVADLLGPSRPVATSGNHDRVIAIRDVLPRLLAEAAAATHGASPADSARAADLAAQIHQIAAITLLHLDAPDLGFVAVREALRWAERAPDSLRAAAVRWSLGHLLMRQGRFVDAERVCVATAEAIQPPGEASPAQLSVYGHPGPGHPEVQLAWRVAVSQPRWVCAARR